MRHLWVRWFAPLLLTFGFGLSSVGAQPIEVQRGHSGLPQEVDEGARTAALPHTVAALCAIMVLVVVCMPTRKS